MDYKTTVTKLGETYNEIFEQGMVVVFNENAPDELAELSALHTAAALPRDVKPGDEVALGNKRYAVTAVGSEANYTLGKMGHCTFVFTGADKAELDGHIVLKGNGMPEIKPGSPFEIYFKN
ncbi:MAG: PTS glucitol/sorbitol transporter subunit IIA [Spirochaetaceae bacterium]|jgi:PTS system glucitol/sorbitol-specific IIA component|nr:PTS glucitol/sorbitol transporter subunit IIA [Spirochaetaceae bacterium]